MNLETVLMAMSLGRGLYETDRGYWCLEREGQLSLDIVEQVLATGRVCRKFSGLRGYYVFGSATIDQEATLALPRSKRLAGHRIFLPEPERDFGLLAASPFRAAKRRYERQKPTCTFMERYAVVAAQAMGDE